jgi:hypothetical protein
VEIHGLANLNLPDGLWLTAMRVVGSNDRINNAPLFGDIALARTPLRLVAPPPDLETLATVTAINGGVEGDFDIPVPVTTSLIDTDVFRYVLTADVRGVQGTVTIQAVRLTFSPQP